jgi:urea transport system permease protein
VRFYRHRLESWFTAALLNCGCLAWALLFIVVTLFMQQGMLGVEISLKRKTAGVAKEAA